MKLFLFWLAVASIVGASIFLTARVSLDR